MKGVIIMYLEDEYQYKNYKSTFGVKTISNKKYFYKQTKNINEEIEGFNIVNSIYIIPKIILSGSMIFIDIPLVICYF